jgi:NADH:ubiquinone oxidoreductase subunit 5 (subunit L)/multisubunit Na+/H+ antiporter MnhA subunit
MYLNDSKIKHLLAIFFGIGIAEELSTLLNLQIPMLSLVYVVGLMVLIFNFNKLKEGKYIWEPGLGLIGIFAIIYLFFFAIDYKEDIFKKISAVVSLLVWIRCISYLSEDKTEEDQEDPEINNENENI